ncbi:hypothetical protein JZ751_016592, partial [Albula glossodonta]
MGLRSVVWSCQPHTSWPVLGTLCGPWSLQNRPCLSEGMRGRMPMSPRRAGTLPAPCLCSVCGSPLFPTGSASLPQRPCPCREGQAMLAWRKPAMCICSRG